MKKLISIDNLLFLAIFSMPLYLIRINIFGLPSSIFELLAILTTIALIIEKRGVIIEKLRSVLGLLLASISLIIGGVFFSILFNNDYRTGFGIFKSWFLVPIFFSFALYLKLDSKELVEKIFLAIYFSTLFTGFIAIVYKFLGFVTYDNRLTAFYLSPNHLAMYLSPGIFFGCYFLAKYFFQEKYSGRFFIYALSLLIIFASFYFTYSYGAWLAVLLSFLIMIVIFTKRKRLFFLGILSAFAIVILFSQADTQKFSTIARFSERSSLASRMMIWKASFLMIQQRPVLGIGPGNFQTSYLSLQKYFSPYLEWAVPEPHNIFLAFWIQAGFLGLTGFLFLLYFIFHSLLIILKNKKSVALATPLFGFFLYTVLHGLVDTPYWKNDLSFLFWISVILVLYLYNNSFSKE